MAEAAAFKDYEIVRCVNSTSKWNSYLAHDASGNKVLLTFIDKEKIVERARFMAFSEGAEEGSLDKIALGHYHSYLEQVRQIVGRCRGIGNSHVGTVYDVSFDKEKDQLVVISEYVPGIDLLYASSRLKPAQQIFFFTQILDGLDFIHSNGFLHLNIKPARIHVNFEIHPPVAKITDFGFAVPIGKFDGDYKGTLTFMPPEIGLKQIEKIDERADLYSLGVTMYYCLSGHNPLDHRHEAYTQNCKIEKIIERESPVFSPLKHYNKNVPDKLDEIVLNLIEKDPDKRKFRSAGALLKIFYENWPRECEDMQKHGSSTLEFAS